MNRVVLFTVIFILSITGKSQTAEPTNISADRPGMATPPSVLQAKKVQIETGLSYEKIISGDFFQENFYYNTTLLRYWINNICEIRLLTDYLQTRTDSSRISGLDPLTVGTKVEIAEGKGVIPNTSLLFNLTLPRTGKKDFSPDHPAPSIYVLMQNDIAKKFSICYNLGLEFDGADAAPAEFVALCFSYDITDRLSTFLESYNWFSHFAEPEDYLDAGFALTIRNNLQLDISGNMNLRAIKDYYMFSLGIAWRLPK